MKLPATPESIKASVDTVLWPISNATGTLIHEVIDLYGKIGLTARGVAEVGRTGQDDFRWPAWPQYMHK